MYLYYRRYVEYITDYFRLRRVVVKNRALFLPDLRATFYRIRVVRVVSINHLFEKAFVTGPRKDINYSDS